MIKSKSDIVLEEILHALNSRIKKDTDLICSWVSIKYLLYRTNFKEKTLNSILKELEKKKQIWFRRTNESVTLINNPKFEFRNNRLKVNKN